MTTQTAPTSTVDPRAAALMADLFGGALEDPFPCYAELREIGDGVHWSEQLQAYLVCRYDDVRVMASDHARFSSAYFYDSAPSWHDSEDAEHVRFIDAASRLFMFSDPPVHTRIRSTFRHVFTPTAIAAWEPKIRQVTEELIGRYPRGEELDVMPGFAADVPVAVIAAILGVPDDAREKFREWSYAFASTFDPVVLGDKRDAAITTSLELFDYLGALIEQRRAQPRDDLISELIQTETLTGDTLTDIELVAQLALLLVAGNETTTTLIGTGLTQLLGNPAVLAEIRADRSALPAALEEILRIDSPLHIVLRKTTAEVRFGDTVIPPDTILGACIAAANRDPRQFDNPDELKIDRPDNKHLAFFHGIHFCVGAPLARLEGRVVFDHILDNYPNLRPGVTPARRRTTNAIARGWETRPVIL
ncbi:MAG: cytochrome P450 [Actinomycetota bacterium]|nr:cytochrome P450 [Actinomycetota bacterium]